MASTTIDTHPIASEQTRSRTAERRAWLGFAVVCLSAVMDLLDSTIAQTAAPQIRRSLGGSYADLEWISAGYTLAMAVSLLVGGRLGDLFGRRRVLLAGMSGFIATSTLCALASSPDMLIGFRALQGLTGAVMIPQGFGLIRELFGDEGQQKAFGVFGPVMGLTAIAGPLLGGALVDANVLGSGWRAIFLVNVPLGLLALALGRRHLPASAPVAAGQRIDPLSVALAVAGGTAIVYPLVQGRELGWPLWSLLLPVAGAALLAAFGLRQTQRIRRGDTPLVDASIFGRRAYVSGLALVLCFIGAMGGMLLALNVMFQTGLGKSPLGCGVATLTIPVCAIFGSITSSVFVGRIGRRTLHIGVSVMAAGLVVTDLVLRAKGAQLSAWTTAAPLAVTGFGMGMIFMPMFDIILAGVEPQQLGSASGLLESVQQLGMSLGIAVTGTVLFDAVGVGHGAGAFVGAADHALLVCVALLAAGFVATFWLPRHAREQA